MKYNHFKLIQGYIGNLTASHDNTVNIVTRVIDSGKTSRVYLLLSHILSEMVPLRPLYIQTLSPFDTGSLQKANLLPRQCMEHIQIIPAQQPK